MSINFTASLCCTVCDRQTDRQGTIFLISASVEGTREPELLPSNAWHAAGPNIPSDSTLSKAHEWQTFVTSHLFPSIGEGKEPPTLFGPLEKGNLNHWIDWRG